MADPIFNTSEKIPLPVKPSTPPTNKEVYKDLFDIFNTIRMLIANFLVDAPKDGTQYGRQDGEWTPVTGGGGGGIPEAPVDGQLYGRKDAAWEVVPGGGGGSSLDIAPFVAPPTLGWNWFNQGAATFTSTSVGLQLVGEANGAGLSLRGLSRPLPATNNYTVTACVRFTGLNVNYISGGIALRNSVTGAVIPIVLVSGGTTRNVQLFKANNPTSYNSDYIARPTASYDLMWVRIQDNGTDRIFSLSTNGYDWFEYFRVGRTDFTTPDHVGFTVSCENTGTPFFVPTVRLLSWEATIP